MLLELCSCVSSCLWKLLSVPRLLHVEALVEALVEAPVEALPLWRLLFVEALVEASPQAPPAGTRSKHWGAEHAPLGSRQTSGKIHLPTRIERQFSGKVVFFEQCFWSSALV